MDYKVSINSIRQVLVEVSVDGMNVTLKFFSYRREKELNPSAIFFGSDSLFSFINIDVGRESDAALISMTDLIPWQVFFRSAEF